MTDLPDIPEPPDGTRIEFTYETDLYAAWRNDASSITAEWADVPGDGQATWCLYGDDVPMTWATMVRKFGAALRDAARLVPVFGDVEPAKCGCPVIRQVTGVLRHTRRCSDQRAAQAFVTDSSNHFGADDDFDDVLRELREIRKLRAERIGQGRGESE